MSVAAPISPEPPATRPTKPLKTSRWSGYRHLLDARLKELRREPEVVFWIFIFPLLLALGLGIAFRDKPAETSRVAIESSPGATHALELLNNAPDRAAIHAEILPPSEAENAFRFGKFDL